MTIPGHTIFNGQADLAGKRVGVIGLARTGLACVRYLIGRDVQVVGADAKSSQELADIVYEVTSLGGEVVTEFGELDQLGEVDLLVLSPGVPCDHPAVREAHSAGIEVIGEVELAYRFAPVPMIAISGTNGKGTTTRMVDYMLDAAGIANVVAGNIGVPMISQLERARHTQIMVVEVSSFQLATIADFRPWIAVLLNIAPDHLDRHGNLADYAAAKARLFQNQTIQDYSILCIDDPLVADMQTQVTGTLLTVSNDSREAAGRLEEGYLVTEIGTDGSQRILPIADMPVPGEHNLTNALAAALAAGLCGATAAQRAEGLKRFQPVDHLLQKVVEVGGIKFIDDSKATNTAAAMADLTTISGPVLAIAGGRGKEADFSEFGQQLGQRTKFVCLIGESGPLIEASIGEATDTVQAATMEQAIEECYRRAESGDTIVLLPGCASFDMFDSQTRRGEVFMRLARRITGREAGEER